MSDHATPEDAIAKAGEMAVKGTVLNAYIALRLHDEATWRLRRKGGRAYFRDHHVENNERGALYAARMDHLSRYWP